MDEEVNKEKDIAMKPWFLCLLAAMILACTSNPSIALEADARPLVEQPAEKGLPDGWVQCRVFGIASVAYLSAAYLVAEDASPFPPLLAGTGLGLIWYGTGMKPGDTKGQQLIKGLSIFAGMLCVEAALIWHLLENAQPEQMLDDIPDFRQLTGMVGIALMIKTLYEGMEVLATTDWWWR